MLWGPDGIMIYNDAYSVFAGGRHPTLLGSKVLEGWPEVADLNSRVLRAGFRGETLSFRDEHLVLHRPGRPKDVWVNLDYSPLLDDYGAPAGVLAVVVETTDRVLAERALRRSQTELARVQQIGRVGGFEVDLTANFRTRRSREYLLIHGLAEDAEEGNYADWAKRVHPEDLAECERDFYTAINGDALSYTSEYRIIRPVDGKVRWVVTKVEIERDEHGRALRLVGAHIDITDRKQVEQTLRDREAELARVQQIGKVGGVEVDLRDGFRNRRSPEYLAIHGLPPEAERETHEDWVRRIHPDDRERTERQFVEAVNGNARDYTTEYRIVRPSDGQVRWIAVKAQIERNEHGDPLRLVGAHIDVTDSKIAEQALRESEQRFRLVSENAPVMLWMGGIQGACLYLNRKLREFWGVAEEAADTFDWGTMLHPDDRNVVGETIGKAMRERVPFRLEAHYRRHDGEYRLLRTDAQPRFDATGTFLGMIGVNVDITEARRSEQALKESEERFRRIANSAPVPMWVRNLDGTHAFVNQAFMDFFGISVDDVVAFDPRQAIHADDLTGFEHEQAAGERSKQLYVLEARYRRADGEWRWLRTEAQPRWGPAAAHIGFIGIAHDITVAKQAEIELRDLNETLEAQVEARTLERDRIWNVSQDMLVVSDNHGVWQNVNPAARSILGWSEAELVGRTSQWLEHPDDISRSRAEVKNLAAGRITLRFENRLRHKGGSYRWLSWTAASQHGMIYAVARDITDEKDAAETLRRTEDALRQAQKMEAVGQLTGGIAHDFNNLLQGIIGSLDLVQKRLADGRLTGVQRFLDGAMASANRAASLTHRLLAFSRRQPLDPKPLRVNPLVISMEELLRRTTGEQIEIELVLDAELWTTLCDHNQLENSILNLAINSRDAMPNGGKLRIRTGNRTIAATDAVAMRDIAPGDYVCLTVTDTGTGMTPDVAARAFDPFYTTKPIGRGTGLGLSMIYGFAHQSHGHAKIVSEVGKGTSVTLFLPRHDVDPEASEDNDRQMSERLAGSGRTVLVIEDEVLVRMLVVETLTELGFRSIEAEDGPSGLSILQSRQSIDLLVTDIGLPGLNGRQIADAARLVRPELKILFMTGYAETAAMTEGTLEPGMEMITKPFVIDALSDRIRRLIAC
jgi:PAS domain S-box-containing protein